MGFESGRSLFFDESREMLAVVEENLLALEEDPSNTEAINALFRALHTIKGSSGMFSFNKLMNFAHKAESMMDEIRQGKKTFTSDAAVLLLKSHDLINEILIYAEKNGDALSDELNVKMEELLEAFQDSVKSGSHEKSGPSLKAETSHLPAKSDSVKSKYWHISLRPKKDIFRHGYDPYSFIKYLQNKGEIVRIQTVYDNLPDIDVINHEECSIGFEIIFDSKLDRPEIAAVFDFIIDDCVVSIIPPHAEIEKYKYLLRDLPEGTMRLGDILVSIGALTKNELNNALSEQAGSVKKIGEIVENHGIVTGELVKAAIDKQKAFSSEDTRKKSIRVDAEKLDSLINLVGELVINGASIGQKTVESRMTDMNESVSIMNRLIDEVRNSVLNLRMVQIGEVFAKFKRIVRDLSKELGKDVELVIEGGDTELDKTIIEKISDPIMHIVRNAVDHGITTPEDRVVKGKPAQGTIRLNAYHETGSIVIEVSDDGEGMKTDVIRRKGIEKGLIKQDQILSEKEIFDLIFEPGFSTAESVTNISGRGVGMDVVKRNISFLRGTVDVQSTYGTGTMIKIRLPLTLSIIDGFRVCIAGKAYVLPLGFVIECIEIRHKILEKSEGSNFINLRGEVLPYIKMRNFFMETDNTSAIENVVIVEYAGKKAGLVVDSLLGEFQTVIKPLGRIYKNVSWLSGATILGNGEISLILDVPQLITVVSNRSKEKR